MPKHYIQYITRRVVAITETKTTDWFALPQQPSDGFARPVFHTSRKKPAGIEPGDIFWLIGQLYFGKHRLPLSLDAKIIVDSIETVSDHVFRFNAAEESRWFPLRNATAISQQLRSINSKNEVRNLLPPGSYAAGIYLQSARQLYQPIMLEEWADETLQLPFHFISYRVKDGTYAAFKFAEQLLQQEKIVFWDRWSLPRRLVERREQVSDGALDDYLFQKIRSSSVTWGIETPAYSEPGCYAKAECELAVSLNKYHPVPWSNNSKLCTTI